MSRVPYAVRSGTPHDVRGGERGEGVVEVVIASAMVGIALAAVLSGAVAAAHRFGAQPADEALRALAQRELRIAVDVMKYRGGRISPAAISTTAPIPGGSPLPVHLSISIAPAGGGYGITLTASADGSAQSATAATNVAQPVPAPSSLVAVPGSAPAPL